MATIKPISTQARKSGMSGWGLVAFFGLFLLVGLAAFYAMFVRPVQHIQAAKTWAPTPCVVASSRVQSHSGSKGSTTYSVEISYAYRVNNRRYQASRYDFMGGSSSGYSGKEAVVRRYPPGRETVCYVNPADPADAVLERGFSPAMWFGLIPLVFVLVGGGGMIYGIRTATRPVVTGGIPVTGASGWAPSAAGAAGSYSATGVGGPVTLKPKASPALKLFGAIAVCLFWNGIVSVFVWHVVEGWRSGKGEWPLTLFMIPFVAVGLGMVAFVGYSFLALFNPRLRLTVSAGQIAPGGSLDLDWELTGQTSRLERFSIFLEAREEATYRRGTSSYTDRQVFANIPVTETTAAFEMANGRARVMVPPGAMHSFKSANNKIVWALQVKGAIPRWPDIKEEFEIIVSPAPAVRNGEAETARIGAGAAAQTSSDTVHLELSDAKTGYRPGDQIAGTASWELDNAPKTAEVRLFWYTRGKGTVDAGLADTVRLDAPGARDRRPFQFRLPDAPQSFSGKLVSLIWAVELVLAPSKQTARLELTVSPTGEEIVLPTP